jgi:hypothetical protein
MFRIMEITDVEPWYLSKIDSRKKGTFDLLAEVAR